MAFECYSHEKNLVPTYRRVPSDVAAPEVGMALAMSDGKLALATGTTRPGYISVVKAGAAVREEGYLLVLPAGEEITFKTTFAADASGINVGDKVTIHTDGMQVTATTAGGVAEVVNIIDSAAGGEVLVRFPK